MGSVDSTAWVAPSAVVTGDVTPCPRAGVPHGAVLNGGLGPVVVGSDVVVVEHALLRGRADRLVRIGDAVPTTGQPRPASPRPHHPRTRRA